MSTNLNSSWVPNEAPQVLFSERNWLQGVFLCAVAYGITIPLYVLTFGLLMREKDRVGRRNRLPMLIYVVVLFLLGTLYMCTLSAFNQMAFIDDRNYPGGPNVYENAMFASPVDSVANVILVLTNWLCDALFVWRFKVIYQTCQVPLWIMMIFPCLMFAGSVALGIAFLIQVSASSPFSAGSGVNFTLPYFSLSLALNIILTTAIVLRLLNFRYRIVSVMGPRHGTFYTSSAAMIIESAALYSTVSIAFLILFGIGNAVSQAILQALTQIQTVATLLILFRVAQGRGWKEETAAYVMTARRSAPLELTNMRITSPGTSITLENSEETMKKVSGEL